MDNEKRQRQETGVFLIPNLITIARLIAVPVVVWAIATHEWDIAFWVFIAAGLSDAVDGYIAKRFGLESDLGAHLDPLADKALLVSVYVTCGIISAMPVWLVALVVSRDILIVGAVVLALVMAHPVPMRPLAVSKTNTFAQILLAGVVLADLAFGLGVGGTREVLSFVVAGLTGASAAAYVVEWLGHMISAERAAETAGELGPERMRPAPHPGRKSEKDHTT
ncbi:CDP-diacylglycerol--glycerol-3-phosphate 3-phosphatidyltransferase [Pseudoxanthobacter soli DSM 19599]|uniref:CDP-diacylglycerol--glycerol-3-phosphate 3-phosphatidyltransferase n=1 Tax=Pseudoxanthobacter soli DSM 19599 TaxID=1123029 RepID=A0A1M7ZLK2_9HYPH|nr:CDP-diacylglycerol--glycerol-3-phosphate 3-phosphatidyltransferase [Pseudoxanthobacter soli DSM 19599]